jgi:CheY-like chemotaxis protein
MSNAVKFTDQGEVLLRVRALEQTPRDGLLEFSVRDSGIGISAQDQSRIFGGFSQVEASYSRRFGGIGLGLSIGKRLVNLMGGNLRVQSELGVGSTFSFQVRMEWVHEQLVPAVVKPKGLKGMRILVVEDNKINQMVAQGLLSKEGALVTLADNGELGVAAVEHANPQFDIVLMDLQMPVMDGLTATLAIRKKWDKTRLPIVALTANASETDRENCLKAEMNDHVGKPIEIDHLVSVLLAQCSSR